MNSLLVMQKKINFCLIFYFVNVLIEKYWLGQSSFSFLPI